MIVIRIDEAARKTGGGDGKQLHEYWTKSAEGLAKWASSPHPWTALHAHLVKHMKNPDMAARVTSAWYHDVFGVWPGTKQKKGKGKSTRPAAAKEADWNAEAHPRDKNGKFIKIGASVTVSGTKYKVKSLSSATSNDKITLQGEWGTRAVHPSEVTVVGGGGGGGGGSTKPAPVKAAPAKPVAKPTSRVSAPKAPATPRQVSKPSNVDTSSIKSAKVRARVEAGISRVPTSLRHPNLEVRSTTLPAGQVALYQNNKILIDEKALARVMSGHEEVEGPPGASRAELAEWVIVHELGHGVTAGMWHSKQFLGQRGKNTLKFGPKAMHDAWPEVRHVTGYAGTNADEGWAEAFMMRIHDPSRSFGPKSEAIFKELGI